MVMASIEIKLLSVVRDYMLDNTTDVIRKMELIELYGFTD